MDITYVDLTMQADDGWTVTWPVSGVGDSDAIEVSVDGTTWAATTRAAGLASVFCHGPSYGGTPPSDKVALPLGPSRFWLRRTSAPDNVQRDGGSIVVR